MWGARCVEALPPKKKLYSEIVTEGSRKERKRESKRMAGNYGGQGREFIGPAAAGPYHCDWGALGAGRAWERREDWARRGPTQHDGLRGGWPGRRGGFGRGPVGPHQGPGAGREGLMNSGLGRWVWQEDKREDALPTKSSSGKITTLQQAAGAGLEGSTDCGLGKGTEAREEPDGSQDGDAARLGGKCSRCSKKGHQAAACTVEICCVICNSNDHMNYKCHLLKAPRPVAHGAGYAVIGLGFYHIPHPPLPRVKKDTKKALVSVVGGILSGEQLIKQLRRVVLVKWNWELKEYGEGKFITQFPSKAELQRSIAYGGADAKGKGIPQGIRLQFEEWQDKEKGFLLPKVWLRLTGIEEPLREFQILWAVGSLLGSTQSMDMETTRKSDFGWILVAILDPKLMPRTIDVVIGDH